jgi:hypothetical protein
VQAQWSIDYLPLFLLFGGAAVAVTVVTVGAVSYKRRMVSRRRATLHPQKTDPIPATLGAAELCNNCGNYVPKGAEFCKNCGTPVAVIQNPALQDRVYDYIVNHEGVISMSVASADLGIPIERLKEITERLKTEGRLS